MKALQRSGPFAFIVALAILLTACSGLTGQSDTMTNTNNQNMNKAAPTAKTTPMTGTTNNNGGMMQGIAITQDMTGDTKAFIRTGKATIDGKAMNVLTTTTGFAVYYYKPDTALKSTCTGQCAKDWPPVLAPQGMMTISSSVTLPKKLSIHQTANGAQVFYDGHALYTYAQDTQMGRVTGRGEDMKWYLVGFQL